MLSWRLSNTLDARLCTDALSEALQRYGRPEIFNSDQGSQFTSVLTDPRVVISMDGRGRCMDNVLIERLWRSLKYETVYHHERQPHFALGGSTPADAYENADAGPASLLAPGSAGMASRVRQDPGGMASPTEYTLWPPSFPTKRTTLCSFFTP